MGTLPLRVGSRPATSSQIPHRQNDQQPADRANLEALLEAASAWTDVTVGESGVSVEGARALVLRGDGPAGPPEAFMIGREFCHGHAQGDFSLHACLPLELAAEAERTGWAEPHFLALSGRLPATVMMLYAPRDESERAVVLDLVRASYEFARTPVPARGGERS
jgi:phospholipase/carboxylesterase